MVLVGQESDLMFEAFKEALLGAARANVGEAHFLFADGPSEPRIAPLLRSARAAVPGSDPGAEPVVVLVSMINAFRPRKLEGSSITADGLNALLRNAKQEAMEEEEEEPLVLKKGPKVKPNKKTDEWGVVMSLG